MTAGRGRLIRDTGHAITGRVAATLLWVVLTPALLRALDAERFGLWAVFLALTGYFGGFDLGLSQGTLRHVAIAHAAGRAEESSAHATFAALGYLALGALWLVVLALAGGVVLGFLRVPAALVPEARFLLFASAATFAAAGVANVTVAALQGARRFDLANLVMLAGTVAQGGGAAWALARGAGLRGLAIAVLAGWSVGGLVGMLALAAVPGFRWTGPRAAFARAREALAFGLPMQWAAMCATLHQHLDKFLLARWVALAAVAPFEIGFRIASAAVTLPQQFLVAVLPRAASFEAAGQRDALRDLYQRGDRLMMGATAVWLAVLAGGAAALLTAWIGNPDPKAIDAARGLSLAWAIALATGMGTSVARAIGRTDLEARFATVVVVVHLGLSLLLVPRWDVRGAVIATLAANAVGTVVFLVLLARALDWPATGVLLAGKAWPALAAVLGTLAGHGVDLAWPPAPGAAAWVRAGVVAATAGVVATGVLFGSRALRQELRFGWRADPGAAG